MVTRGLVWSLLLLSGCGVELPPSAEGELGPASMTDAELAAVLDGAGIDPNLTTHLLIVGYSHGQGTQFADSAMARARRYRELYPHQQVVFFARVDAGLGRTDEDVMSGLGARVVSDEPNEPFYAERLLRRMRAFRAIASFDFYGHSSAWGIGIEEDGPRLGTSTSRALVESVRSNFTADAYATLNGCHAGRAFAPWLSNAWRIPVSAALTGSNFQALHTDGQWYVNDAGRAPPGAWAKQNSLSYQTPLACSKGACLRLKPENAPYSGYWGRFEGGLGFYKFFCNYGGGEDDCSRRMALSLLSTPSLRALPLAPSREDFERVVTDWLCPNDASSSRFNACADGLRSAAASGGSYSSFQGTPLECGDSGCDSRLECDVDANGAAIPGTCREIIPANPSPRTQVSEYRRYLRGLELLGGSAPSSGPIDRSILMANDHYDVIPEVLNCRERGEVGAAVLRTFARGARLIALDDTAVSPRVSEDSRGRPWLWVRGEDAATACYVSASYEYIRPGR